MKSCIVSFLVLGCLVSSSYSKLPGLMNPGAGADLKAKSTTMESGIWSDDDIKSGKSFKDQEKHLITIAKKGGCDCSKNEALMNSLNAQLDLLNQKLPGSIGKQVQLTLQNVKLALKISFVPLNLATGGLAYNILDKVIPTEGSRVEDILGCSDGAELTQYMVGETLKFFGGGKYEKYSKKLELPSSGTDCVTICSIDKRESPAVNSLKQIQANEDKCKPEVRLALHVVKIALKVGFLGINGASGGVAYGVLDAVIPTQETIVEQFLGLSDPRKAVGLLLGVAQKYAKEPGKLRELYDSFFG